MYDILAFTSCWPAEIVDSERKRPDDGTWDELFADDRFGVSLEDFPETPADPEKQLENLLIREQLDRGRPNASCYEDVKLMIIRHPETSCDTPAMAAKFIHHKGADNKRKPTIFFFTPARKFIFCTVTKIISCAVRDGAFAAKNLHTVDDVFRIRNKKGTTKCTPDASSISLTEPLPYHQLRDIMARQSLDYGCETAIEPKAWRWDAANAANGKASDVVRDQMMRHDPKWETFNSVYINEHVEFDLQNVYCKEPTNMVPQEIWDQLRPHPNVLELEKKRVRLKVGKYYYHGNLNKEDSKEIGKTIRALKAQRVKDVIKQYRKFYFESRPTWDIEQQDGGSSDDVDMDDPDEDLDDGFHRPDIDLDIPERAQLAQLVYKQAARGLERDIIAQRAAEEVEVKASPRSSRIDMDAIPKHDSSDTTTTAATDTRITKPVGDDVAALGDPFPCRMHKFQCTECIGDEELLYKDRTFCYTRASSRNDHFDSCHLPTLTNI
ncbi:hypothetical protein CLAIMM_13783 [Cladophialophora immunda]|nr:hypothetical protein CLAIMM_13783 [Cladophialophora immunda]